MCTLKTRSLRLNSWSCDVDSGFHGFLHDVSYIWCFFLLHFCIELWCVISVRWYILYFGLTFFGQLHKIWNTYNQMYTHLEGRPHIRLLCILDYLFDNTSWHHKICNCGKVNILFYYANKVSVCSCFTCPAKKPLVVDFQSTSVGLKGAFRNWRYLFDLS